MSVLKVSWGIKERRGVEVFFRISVRKSAGFLRHDGGIMGENGVFVNRGML